MFYISLIVISFYIAFVIYKFKVVPESISETYYMLGSKGWLFQLAMFITGMCLLPSWLNVSEEAYRFLCFLCCASICFIACAPAFYKDLERTVHYSSAVICGVSAFIWQVFEGLWDVQMFCAIPCIGGILKNYKNYMWWIEIAIISSLFLNLIRMTV